ncbi:MAG: dihydropteroate synthase [Desulfobacterales bacterium]
MKTYEISCGSGVLTFGGRTRIMGIVNVTPDSFSDGGDFFSHERAVNQGMALYEAGADVLDIGGESTRPFSDPVSIEEEIHRVVPVIAALVKRVAIPISVDTTKAAVAKRALDAGAAIINDISALRFDPEMAKVAARYRTPVILMHMKGKPKDMQVQPVYNDLMGEVLQFLKDAMRFAEQNGIVRSALIVDPGIGFGKTASHNLFLLKHLAQLRRLDVPILVGTSRKAFLRNLVAQHRNGPADAKGPDVAAATQISVAAAVLHGAHMVRVHDVADTALALQVVDAIKNA